eukprot:scaffold34966_cov30-Tisochrysis_lutea.AAC.4
MRRQMPIEEERSAVAPYRGLTHDLVPRLCTSRVNSHQTAWLVHPRDARAIPWRSLSVLQARGGVDAGALATSGASFYFLLVLALPHRALCLREPWRRREAGRATGFWSYHGDGFLGPFVVVQAARAHHAKASGATSSPP